MGEICLKRAKYSLTLPKLGLHCLSGFQILMVITFAVFSRVPSSEFASNVGFFEPAIALATLCVLLASANTILCTLGLYKKLGSYWKKRKVEGDKTGAKYMYKKRTSGAALTPVEKEGIEMTAGSRDLENGPRE